ncbi:Ribonuclease Z, mitochondrial [Halotydeus destructor]|nr:Ribonuclease Z, mitochondrial [Halotydeus destructor]
MPKEPLAARALKKYRQEKMANARFSDLIPGRVAMYILGNGGPGNPGVIYLTTDHKTYLFNCGEGAQRLSHEHGLKLTKLQHLFLTRTCWDTMGGLPGLSMTMQAMGIPGLSIHSPKNITKLFELTKLFSITADMDIKEFDTTKDVFSDSTMDVSYVRVGNSSANGDNSKKVKLDREPVLCYICRLQRQPSSLNIRKCMELGIPKGPHLGILKNGGEYKFPDGRVVNYQDVTTLGEPGPVFIILDCPDIDYIDDLISNHELNECQSLQEEEKSQLM